MSQVRTPYSHTNRETVDLRADADLLPERRSPVVGVLALLDAELPAAKVEVHCSECAFHLVACIMDSDSFAAHSEIVPEILVKLMSEGVRHIRTALHESAQAVTVEYGVCVAHATASAGAQWATRLVASVLRRRSSAPPLPLPVTIEDDIAEICIRIIKKRTINCN